MAINVMTHREPVRLTFPIVAATLINPGDFVWFDRPNATLKPIGTSAGLVTTWSSEAQARRAATSRFAGIANFQSMASSPAQTVQVLTSGFARVKVASATYRIGDLLGFKKDAGGNYLYSDQLQKVLHPCDAVAIACDSGTSITELECFLIGSRDLWNSLVNSVKQLVVALEATAYAANTNILLAYTFGFSAKIARVLGVTTLQTTGANVFTWKNGSNSIDDTLTIATASPIGTVTAADIDDATGYDIFEHNDQLNITCDSGASAGAATIITEYYNRPIV
jgi:hypothetical protein